MPDVTLEDLSSRPDWPDRVLAETERLAGFWAAGQEGLNTAPGSPLRDLVATPDAEAGVLNLERVDRVRRESSLYELVLRPELVQPDSLDRVLANHPTLKRRQDAPARGWLALHMPDDTITAVLRNSRFRAGDLIYRTEDTYICTPGALTKPNNRPLLLTPDGTWRFTIPVTAEGNGEPYNVRAGTVFTWVDTATRVSRIVADTDFTGGVAPETNQELLNRLDAGLAAPGDAGRMNLQALILREFPSVVDISLIGAGDLEMKRDGRNALGLKAGGKTDCYVRTALGVATLKAPLAATVVDLDQKILQVYVHRDVYPGFYELTAVRRSGQLGPPLEVLEQTYGCDRANLPHDVPELVEPEDYRFTRYQTLLVRFRDPDYDPKKPDYEVELLGQPRIGDIQDYLARRDVRSPNNDLLVKAALPCLVTVSLTVEYLEAGPAIDFDQVAEAAAGAVTRIRFEHGKLSTSGIIQAVQNLLPATAQVQPPIDLLGRTLRPTGRESTARATTELLPDEAAGDPATSRTVSYFVQRVTVTPKPVVRLQV